MGCFCPIGVFSEAEKRFQIEPDYARTLKGSENNTQI
jgi:hypothetical protein